MAVKANVPPLVLEYLIKGAPHLSILGPSTFNIFINDIFYFVKVVGFFFVLFFNYAVKQWNAAFTSIFITTLYLTSY